MNNILFVLSLVGTHIGVALMAAGVTCMVIARQLKKRGM